MPNTPDYSSLPMILTVKDVGAVLNLPKNQAYRLFRSKKFPCERVNGKYIIPKPRFLHWLGVTTDNGGQVL